MATKRKSSRLRRLLRLIYHEARTYRKPRIRPTGIPGPAFDVVVIATLLVFSVILLI